MPLLRPLNYKLMCEILLRLVLIGLFCYLETINPFERVIHRPDLETSLHYPRKESYVPSTVLWGIIIVVPFMLSFTAWILLRDYNDAIEILLSSSLAIGLTGVITDVIKLTAGRPRPDFFYRCFPDGVESDNLRCTGHVAEIAEGRKSFPSGHTSLCFCAFGTASLWMTGRLKVLSTQRGSGIRVCACLTPLVIALCVGISRTCDYHHHWEDVLVGSLLGSSLAYLCYSQYYNSVFSEDAGMTLISNGSKEVPCCCETTPSLSKKVDKWI